MTVKALIGVAVLLLATVLIGIAIFSLTGDEAQSDASTSTCTARNDAVSTEGPAVKPALTLNPDAASAAKTINFGSDRNPEAVSLTFMSDTPVSAKVVKRLNPSIDTITRTGNVNDETVNFPEPSVSPIKATGNRKRLRFLVCLRPPHNLPAGKYTGVITLDGPVDVDSSTATITANAKDQDQFIGGLAFTLLAAALVLFYKGVADRRAAAIAAVVGSSDEESKTKAAQWRGAVTGTLEDPSWIAPTIFTLGAATGALLAVYNNDPTWGAGATNGIPALIAAGLAAVGAKAIFTPSK
jgi:hypothetical protein